MWSSSAALTVRPLRLAAVLAALLAALALSGCTGFAPVYSTAGPTASTIAVRYGSPASRLDQIVYADLALRLGPATGNAPLVTVRTRARYSSLTSDLVTTAQVPHRVTLPGALRITDAKGKVLFSGSRVVTADYNTDAQVLANSQAASDAAERAAHLLADSLRLTILGVLAR
jgi:hypothetical protein